MRNEEKNKYNEEKKTYDESINNYRIYNKIIEKQIKNFVDERISKLGSFSYSKTGRNDRFELLNYPKKDVDKCNYVIKQLESILDADKREREREARRNLQQIELNKKKLKDLMKSKIKKTKDMLKELNEKEMDASAKLSLLQNKQLIAELDYQSQQSEKLICTNNKHEAQIAKLKREIDIHKQVEIELAKKAKIYQSQLEILKNENNNKKPECENKESSQQPKNKFKEGNDGLLLFMEEKLEEAEKKFASFQIDHEALRTKYCALQKSVEKMSEKYSRAALLLVGFLDDLLTATPNLLQDEKNLYLDIERL